MSFVKRHPSLNEETKVTKAHGMKSLFFCRVSSCFCAKRSTCFLSIRPKTHTQRGIFAKQTYSRWCYIPSPCRHGDAVKRGRCSLTLKCDLWLTGWVYPRTLQQWVDKQSIPFYEGANTNPHELHRVRGLPNLWVWLTMGTGEVLLVLTARYAHMT